MPDGAGARFTNRVRQRARDQADHPRGVSPLAHRRGAATFDPFPSPLRAMTRLPCPALVRAALPLLVLTVAAGACEKALPTSAEIERMDAAALQARAAAMGDTRVPPTFFVDGQPATEEEVRALPGERIERMELSRGPTGGGNTYRFYTSARPEGEGRGAHVDGSIRFRTDEPQPVYPVYDAASSEMRMGTADRFAGLLVVDGETTDRAGLTRVRPEDVQRIEIIKGTAAVRTYSDPRARNGVIVITTTSGGR